MTSFLVLALALAGAPPHQPPTIRPKGALPRLPDFESLLRDELERARRSQGFMEEQIKWFEKFIGNNPDIIVPARASHLRQRIEVWRQDVEKEKQWVQELERWEQQRKLKPGPETDRIALERLEKLLQELGGPPPVAPMPREVKR